MTTILKILNNKSKLTSNIKEVQKAYTEGVYSDSPLNRKLGRVGMSYKEYAQKVASKSSSENKKEEKENNDDGGNKDISIKGPINIIIKDNVKLTSSQKSFLSNIQKDFAKEMKEENLGKMIKDVSPTILINKDGVHVDFTSEEDWNNIYNEYYGAPDMGYGNNPSDIQHSLENKYKNLLKENFYKKDLKVKDFEGEKNTKEENKSKDNSSLEGPVDIQIKDNVKLNKTQLKYLQDVQKQIKYAIEKNPELFNKLFENNPKITITKDGIESSITKKKNFRMNASDVFAGTNERYFADNILKTLNTLSDPFSYDVEKNFSQYNAKTNKENLNFNKKIQEETNKYKDLKFDFDYNPSQQNTLKGGTFKYSDNGKEKSVKLIPEFIKIRSFADNSRMSDDIVNHYKDKFRSYQKNIFDMIENHANEEEIKKALNNYENKLNKINSIFKKLDYIPGLSLESLLYKDGTNELNPKFSSLSFKDKEDLVNSMVKDVFKILDKSPKNDNLRDFEKKDAKKYNEKILDKFLNGPFNGDIEDIINSKKKMHNYNLGFNDEKNNTETIKNVNQFLNEKYSKYLS